MDTLGCYRFSDGEDECLDSGRCGQCSDVSEDSVGSSGSMQQPGVIIHFFFRKRHLVKKLCGKSQTEYQNQGWIQWLGNLFTQQGSLELMTSPTPLRSKMMFLAEKKNFFFQLIFVYLKMEKTLLIKHL